jgi:hypothetical protein
MTDRKTSEKWVAIDAHTRSIVVDGVRSVMDSEFVSSSAARRHVAAAYSAAADALEDMSRMNDMDAERTRIRRELAIGSAARCYHRCLSRVAQAKIDPDAREWLTSLATEGRAAGDDIIKEAGMDPSEHPMAESVRAHGVLFDLVRWPEWEVEQSTTEEL